MESDPAQGHDPLMGDPETGESQEARDAELARRLQEQLDREAWAEQEGSGEGGGAPGEAESGAQTQASWAYGGWHGHATAPPAATVAQGRGAGHRESVNPVAQRSREDEAFARELQRREEEASRAEAAAAARQQLVVQDPVWGELARGERLSARTMAGAQCCPCCMGDLCGQERRTAWGRVLRTAGFWLLVLYVGLLIFSLTVDGFAPVSVNPMLGPFPDILSDMGAKNLLLLQRGELYRLVTPAALHAGILHLLFNAHIQFRFGIMLELEWGTPIWLGLFVLSALVSTATSCVMMPARIGVGASGALMGLIGAYVVDLLYKLCAVRPLQPCGGHLTPFANALRPPASAGAPRSRSGGDAPSARWVSTLRWSSPCRSCRLWTGEPTLAASLGAP